MKKRTMLSAAALLLAAIMCISLTSCVSISAAELSEGYSRTAKDGGAESAELYTAMADLAFRLLGKTLDPDGGNSLISPYSIAMCLGMLAEGADGETRTQLETLLGMKSDALSRALYAMNARICGKDTPLSAADSVWVREGFPVKSDFLQRNADWYGADVFAAPFDEKTVNDINSWCAGNTDGMIKKMIDSIPAETVMYLINAVCFDAEWEKKYEKRDVVDYLFYNRDGSESSVKMLRSENETFLSSDTFRGFAKEYKGGAFSFVGLLPQQRDADILDAARRLDGETWLRLWSTRAGGAVAGVPEFRYDCSVSLADALKSLGVTDMFDEASSDLGRLSDEHTYCSDVIHKTYIELDRNGTRAAALTGAIPNAMAMPAEDRTVILDRPFICMIVDNVSGMPVFIGVVTTL